LDIICLFRLFHMFDWTIEGRQDRREAAPAIETGFQPVS
jgi:hypothetical protein